MSVPTGSDDSTPDESTGKTDGVFHELGDQHSESSDSLRDAVVDWARHWKAWSLATFSLAVVGWAAFVQPQASPKGYIPIFVGFTLLAVGYVYLDEATQIRLASS